MDQIKIGKFIASLRKEQNLTQAALAEQLGISDKAVSKWETGKSMPDSSLMLDLCEILNINVNELLSGEKIMKESYNQEAEKRLLEMKQELEHKNKQMLNFENFIGYPASISGLILIFTASYIDMPTWIRIFLIAFALIMIITAACICVRLEQKAGFYECSKCHKKFVPTYWQTNLAPHYYRTRYMKCPYCHSYSWQKKSLNDDEEK